MVKAAASYASDNGKAIKPILISFDKEDNNLSIGSTHGSSHGYHFRTAGDKKVIIKKSGKGSTEDIIHIETDEDHDSDTSVHVWTSKDGKLKKIKRSKEVVVEIDDDGNETKKEVIKIKRSGNGEDDAFFFIDDNDSNSENNLYR